MGNFLDQIYKIPKAVCENSFYYDFQPLQLYYVFLPLRYHFGNLLINFSFFFDKFDIFFYWDIRLVSSDSIFSFKLTFYLALASSLLITIVLDCFYIYYIYQFQKCMAIFITYHIHYTFYLFDISANISSLIIEMLKKMCVVIWK